MTRYSRAEIGLRPARGGPGALQPSRVEGIALHWPAMSKPIRGAQAVMAALRGWQDYHMDGQGWSDIGYQVAVDQAGNRYDLRGIRVQSGANGDTDVNQRFGAILLILAPGEEPTPEMVAEVQAVITDHRDLFPESRRIAGHSDIRPEPTACPGPAATRLIRAGAFNPQPATDQSEEDDMALDEKVNKDRTVKQVLNRMDRFIDNSTRREVAMRERIVKALKAINSLPAGATRDEVKRLLEDLDAEITIVVNDRES